MDQKWLVSATIPQSRNKADKKSFPVVISVYSKKDKDTLEFQSAIPQDKKESYYNISVQDV
ncbi:hypothetical protein [Metabacillus sp. RGM 3146]|uniref:hypothetical protein n=1 Tax=Metabacillus sp. RGM 3146 TaxID=3401092 RepID=UPI003B9D0EBF